MQTIDKLSELRALIKDGALFKKEEQKSSDEESLESTEEEVFMHDYLKTAPVIPIHVYQNLPSLLKDCCNVFISSRERDVFLTSALSVMSACFPTIYGIYDGRKVFANLFSFIVAPPSSGKGVLRYAQVLGNSYHKYLLQQTKTLQTKYEAELKKYEQDKEKAKREEMDFHDEKPLPPPKLLLFIPADISTASFIKAMFENQGRGLMSDTEADTLVNANKQDWGTYFHLLLKIFHHEKIEYRRKGSDEQYQIDNPCLSVALTSTPNSVGKLIPSTADGKFSRFLFYCFKEDPIWRDVSPYEGRVVLDDYFANMSDDFLKVIKFYTEELSKEGYSNLIFKLKKEQWKTLNQQFSSKMAKYTKLISEDIDSVIRRLGLIAFRIAMVLSALRSYENGKVDVEDFVCEDIDFESAMSLVDIFIEHTFIMYHKLPKQEKNIDVSPLRTKFYDALPNTFAKKEADEVGKSLKIAGSTVTKYLKFFYEASLLKKIEYGKYTKP